MRYNPDIYHRRSIRLKGYDYSKNGAYFITICTHNKEPYFRQYPELKRIVARQWRNIAERYMEITIDKFIVMPNHIHGIIIIGALDVGATPAVAQKANNRAGVKPAPTIGEDNWAGARPAPTIGEDNRAGARPAPTIGEFVGAFKSLCMHEWLKYLKENGIDAPGKFWQRNYYERVIRNEKELDEIREYTMYNANK